MKLDGAYELLKMINAEIPIKCRVSLSLTPTVYDMTDDIELAITADVNDKRIGWLSILPNEVLDDDVLVQHHANTAIENFNTVLRNRTADGLVPYTSKEDDSDPLTAKWTAAKDRLLVKG